MSRTILITGASKGIGQHTALRLALDGFSIVAHYNQDQVGAEKTKTLIEEQGGKCRLLQFDVTNKEQCEQAITQDIHQHQAYYGVISNAGIIRDSAFPALTYQDWFDVIQTNLNSFYHVIHPCIMPMISLRQGGRIIAMSSVSGVVGNRGQTNYSAAKAGIIGACKALALELAKRKITVNCIAPGLIDTDMVNDIDPIAQKEAISTIPLQRMGTTEEVAALASYLMSDLAGYTTRQVISINGGLA